jgi:hypothetical protein
MHRPAKSNVVGPFGFAHEVPNLGILGASVMGTSGAHYPTLTTEALRGPQRWTTFSLVSPLSFEGGTSRGVSACRSACS